MIYIVVQSVINICSFQPIKKKMKRNVKSYVKDVQRNTQKCLNFYDGNDTHNLNFLLPHDNFSHEYF